MFHVRGVFKIFLGRAPNCDILYSLSVCFFGRVSLKQIEEKTGSGGMLSRKIFEILHGAMAYLVLFKQILTKLFAPQRLHQI